MMLGGVSKMMIVFVPPLASFPLVAAICAWQPIRMRSMSGSHFNIDSLTCLNSITISRRHWRWAWLAVLCHRASL